MRCEQGMEPILLPSDEEIRAAYREGEEAVKEAVDQVRDQQSSLYNSSLPLHGTEKWP